MKLEVNTFWLKIIAIVTMTIDHVGMVFFPETLALRVIGRISFPIFSFLLVEGFFHTSNVRRYMTRIGILALISEVPFDLVVYGKVLDFSYQNVFFTLLVGLIMLDLFSRISKPIVQVLAALAIMIIADFFHFDYGSTGLLIIYVIYRFRSKPVYQAVGMSVINVLFAGGIQSCAALASVPILLYNKKEGWKCKPIFYGFYPVHLLLIYLITLLI